MLYFAPQALPQALGFFGSAAPQALPQALGFSSFLGSAAPQALPHAEGFSSGLAAPQALPQALELLIANEATKPPNSDLFIVVGCLIVDCLIVYLTWDLGVPNSAPLNPHYAFSYGR